MREIPFQALITIFSTNVSCLHTHRFISASCRVTELRGKKYYLKYFLANITKRPFNDNKHKQHKWSHRRKQQFECHPKKKQHEFVGQPSKPLDDK